MGRSESGKQLKDMNLMDDFLFNALICNPKYGDDFARNLLEIILEHPLKEVSVQGQNVFTKCSR